MRFEQLQYYLTVCEKGSISAACAELNLTQQSLSANIRALEEEVGITLLTRNNRGVCMTVAGEKAYYCFQKMQKDWQFFLQEIKTLDIPTDITGEIKIGTMKNYGKTILPPITIFLLKQYPFIEFQTEEKSFTSIIKGVKNGVYDIGFICIIANSINKEIFSETVQFHKLFECQPHLWVSGRSLLARQETLDFSVLEQCTLAMPDDIDQSFYKKILGGLPCWEKVRLCKNKKFLVQLLKENVDVCFDLKYGSYGLYLSDVFYNQDVKAVPLKLGTDKRIYAGYVTLKNNLNPLLRLFEQYFSGQIE